MKRGSKSVHVKEKAVGLKLFEVMTKEQAVDFKMARNKESAKTIIQYK